MCIQIVTSLYEIYVYSFKLVDKLLSFCQVYNFILT